MKPPTSETKSERPCSHSSSFLRESNFRHVTDSAEGSRCGLHTWSAERPSQFSAADCLLTPRNHSEHTYVPRTPQTDDFALGTCLPQEPASAAKLFSPSNFKQSRNCNEKNLRMAATPKGSLVDCMALSNQITLYSWYLIRCSGVHTAEVAVGGFLTPGTAGNERLETATIVQRIEKCRLLAKNGVEVRLMGLIDDCTTVSNGFSVEMVHSFLSGFPYIWNHLLDNEFQACDTKYPGCQVPGKCGLSGGVEMSQLSFEGCSNQEKSVPLPTTSGNKVPVSCDPACQVSGSCALSGGVEMSHLSFEGCSNQEKGVLPLSGNEVPVFCDLAENDISLAPDIKKNIVAEIQTEKEATVIMNEEANTQPPSDGRIQPDIKKNLVAEVQTEKEATGIMNEEANTRPPSDDRIQPDMSNVMNNKILHSSTTDTNLEEESKNVTNAIEETLQENTHFDQSRCKAIQEPDGAQKEAFHALNEEVRAVQTPGSAGIAILDQWRHSEENLGKLVDKEDKSMQKSQVSPRITRSMHRIKRHLDGDQNKISSVSNGVDISVQFDSCALKDCEGEHSPACKSCVNTRFHTLDTLFKKRVEGVYYTRSRRKLAKNDNRDGIGAGKLPNMSPSYYTEVNESPAETGQGSERFVWITAPEKEKEIEEQERLKNSKTTPISKSEVQPINYLTRNDDLQEEVCAAEVLEVNGGNTREAEENLSAVEEFVSLKEVEVSTNAKQEDRLKKRGPGIKYLAKTPAEHPSKAKSSPVCYGVVKEKTRSKAAGRRLTEGEIVDSPRYQSGSKRVNVAMDGKEVHISCKTSMLPPPLPRPRVSVSKRLISAAFGLKTSRSGRLLVPPLAHWCSQSLLRDMDGGIIAISDGSKHMSNVDTENFKFKPPAEAGLKKLQKRLREVATECTPKKKPASIKRKGYSK